MEAIRIKMNLRSITAILFDRYSGVNDSTDKEAQANAIHKLYTNEAGRICLPAYALKASIRSASSEIGKRTDSKKRRNAIRAGLFFDVELIPIGGREPDGIHSELVTRKGTGEKVTRVVTYRPYLERWECEATATIYGLEPENVKQYVELAGLRYGLLGHRPEWGRFEMISFDVVED